MRPTVNKSRRVGKPAHSRAGGYTATTFQPVTSPGDDIIPNNPSISIEGNPTPTYYEPGVPVTLKFSVSPSQAGEMAAIGFRVILSGTDVPPFWTLDDITTNGAPLPDIIPPPGTHRTFDFFWTDGINFDQPLPAMELLLDFVPEGESTDITINFDVISRGGGNERFRRATKVVLPIKPSLTCDGQTP